MVSEPKLDPLLDLSFLSEEEQNCILRVLVRDNELRGVEEGRIRHLRRTVSDQRRLKVLTGDWFNDARSKNHKDEKFGSDIVRASIRRKKKPKGEPEKTIVAKLKESQESPTLPNGTTPTYVIKAAEEQKSDKDQQAEEQVDAIVHEEIIPGQRVIQAHAAPQNFNEITKQQETQDPSTNATEQKDQQQRVGAPPLEPTVSIQLDSDSEGETTPQPVSKITLAEKAKPLMNSSTSNLQPGNTLSGSMMSLFSSGEFGTLEVKGSILFALKYDQTKEELHIEVARCQDLAEAKKQRSDPYVKSYLLPDKSSQSKKKTSIKKKTVNPTYNETLKYKINMLDLRTRILNLSVWHSESLGRNVFLGEVEVPLANWDTRDTQPNWYNLHPRIQMSPDAIRFRGKISLSLNFMPAGSGETGFLQTGELHIWVKEAQGIVSPQGGSLDSLVKSYVLPDDSKHSRQKTRVIKNSVSPVYNHTMVYDGFQAEDLKEACAEFTVWEHETFSSQALGGVRLSLGTGVSYGQPVTWMDSTEEETDVWKAVIEKPNTWVDALLPLRTNLIPRKTAKGEV
ncbi:synaptotagmin-like protein 1 [Erpetoichthys calabaricus]|uniref:Synaptotagmin-like protein 1 n=1 Tax=Erpetoichthys calabaricus TaxID=27687 RepID=A0A8C4T4E9_ERPCA|nr:synaptotagmin-like protein 1 [Erpetoichthys calabaricus]